MDATPTRKRIESTLETIRNRDTAYHDLADRFGALFETRERVRATLLEKPMLVPDIDAARLAAGAPLLTGLDLSPWDEPFHQAAELMFPVLKQSLDLDEKIAQRLHACLTEPGQLVELVRMRLEDGDRQIQRLSEQRGITPPTLLPYVVEAVSGPVLGVIADSLKESLKDASWDHGRCPVCGATPAIAQLALPENEGSEYLVGGGGKKYLHCSLCGHDWHFKRNACAACGNEDSDTREIIHQEGMKGERIEVCRQCGKYMLVVDMREFASQPHLDAIQMGLIHLDVIAQKQRLAPVSSTLWNTLG